MRRHLAYLILPFLAVHCSAPPHTQSFESDGGTSADVTSVTAGVGATQATAAGSGTTLTGSTSSATSQGGMEGFAGAPPGTEAGGNGAGGDGSATADASVTTSSVGGSGGGAATGGNGGAGGTEAAGGMGGNAGTGGASCTPTDEVCDGADNDCDDDVDEGGTCPEGCVGANFEKHRYLFCDRPRASAGNSQPARSWRQAMQYCQNRDLNLALIESDEENAFIYETLVRLDLDGDVWMGATDQEDEELWSWAVGDDSDDWIPFYDQADHEPIDDAFNDWRSGEPNDDGGEDCGIFEDLGGDEWAWDDRDCQTQFELFVCESLD